MEEFFGKSFWFIGKLVGIIFILLGLIFGYFEISDDGKEKMFDFFKKILFFKFNFWIFLIIFLIINTLFYYFFCRTKEDKTLEELKKINENLIIENNKLKSDLRCGDLKERWKEDFKEFKTLNFFDKFENVVKWVRDDVDDNFFAYSDEYISNWDVYLELFDYRKNDKTLEILKIKGKNPEFPQFYSEKIIKIKFTEKGQFFAKEFLKEKNKVKPTNFEPLKIKFDNYS